MRDEGSVRSKAVYLAIGVAPDGRKELLGIWIEQTEGAKFWMRVMSELRDRGVNDILIAIVDGLKGFPDAIHAVFPHTQIQTCIVHLLRNSLEYVGWKKRKAVALALKAIYRASDAETAALALNDFEESPWGQRFPAITAAWRRAWTQVIPFFAYPPEVRRMIYTTNQIEALNSKIRRSVRARGHFPSDEAAMKLIWLQLREVTKDWKMPAGEWHTARAQFALMFGDRFETYS
jgi:putative transposase